jgi:hypothetical protein
MVYFKSEPVSGHTARPDAAERVRQIFVAKHICTLYPKTFPLHFQIHYVYQPEGTPIRASNSCEKAYNELRE